MSRKITQHEDSFAGYLYLSLGVIGFFVFSLELSDFWWGAVIGMVGCVGACLLGIAQLINKTTLQASPREITISHGKLSLRRSRHIDLSRQAIDRFYAKEDARLRSYGRSYPLYVLKLDTTDGKTYRLTKRLSDAYSVAEIQRLLLQAIYPHQTFATDITYRKIIR